MPNHLHVLLYYAGRDSSLNKLVGNGKRFLAYDIIHQLEAQHDVQMINRLGLSVRAMDEERGKKHEVWKRSFDIKQCRTEKFVLQKLNYIHNNPCNGKWDLVKEPHHYLHSSASFYFNGKEGIYPVKDYRGFLLPEDLL